MCGIAGVARFGAEVDDAALVRRMMSRLTHRGPDGEGLVREGNVVLGHRRLAVLDLSPAGGQPMFDPSGRFVVVFNGEIYNYRDLARGLNLGDEVLRSRSDTEVLLHAWAQWGPGALEHLVGQWAFALLDRADGVLWLARDRFGEKPLYYHADTRRLVFASSIEALLADPQTPRALDGGALAEFLTLRYVLAPRTVVRDVRKLPGGSILRLARDGARTETVWYRPRFCPSPNRSERAAQERAREFGAQFQRACVRCTVSDVPVALLLSDGIDSHSIYSALRSAGLNTRAYTFRLAGKGLVAQATAGVEAESVEFTPAEYLAGLDRVCARQTEPVGDLAALATAAVIQRVRPEATVFLCGHGGDEILGGYRLSQDRFRLAALRWGGRLPFPFVRRGLDRRVFGDEPFEIRKRRFFDGPRRSAPARARYLIQRPLPATELRTLFGEPGPTFEGYLSGVERLYDECAPNATDLAQMQEVMIRSFLCEDILPFADASAMAWSAELRMPYLDHNLVDLVLQMPDGERVGRIPGSTNTKVPLRRWARHRIPPEVFHRHKQPFAAGSPAQVLPDPGFVRDRVLSSRALRRQLPGLEGSLAEQCRDWPTQVGGLTWCLVTAGVWTEALGLD